MEKKTVVHKFLELDRKDRKMYVLQVNTIKTLIVTLIKFVFGILYSSIWFMMNAGFYGILCISRYRSIRDYKKIKKEKSLEKKKKIEYTNYLYNGWLLILLGIAYLVMNILMFISGSSHNNIGGYLVYLVALISFSSMVTAIIGLVRYRRKHHTIISAVCQCNIAKALTSIVLTQVVILDEFYEKSVKITKIDATTGMVVGIIIILLGIRMVMKIIVESEKRNKSS